MKKILVVLVLVVIVGAAAWYFLGGPSSGTPPASVTPPSSSPSPTNNPPLPANLPPPVSTTAGNISASQGVLVGTARLAPGAVLDITRVRVAIYDPSNNEELKRVFFAADGSYLFSVTAGEYILDLVKGYGSAKKLPQRIYVGAGETIRLNFEVAN